MTDPIEPIALRLAAFVNEALELDEEPASLAVEILRSSATAMQGFRRSSWIPRSASPRF